MKLQYGLLAASIMLATQAQATELNSGFYIAPSLSYQNFGGNVRDEGYSLETKGGFSFAAGYQFDSPWAVELAFTRVDTETLFTGIDAEAEYIHLDGLYHLADDNNNNWSSYFVAGIGSQSYSATGYDEDEIQINTGYGVKYLFSSNFHARSDVRATLGEEDADLGVLFNIGLVYIFGGASSSNDSMTNAIKETASERVEQKKAELVDKGQTEADKAAKALAEEKAAAEAAAAEAAAAAAKAAAAADKDSDGVADVNDQCPDTKANIKVDANGCAVVFKEFTIDVSFKTNSSEIANDSKSDIKDLAEFLPNTPNTSVVIEGHSDSVGAAAYNKTLSQKRANQVMNLLLSDYSIEASRVTAIGFGEEQPIADNATAEGRKKNRRVVAKVNESN